MTTVKVRFVKAGEEQPDPTKDVDSLVGLAQIVKAQIEAEGMAQAGNYSAALNVMHVASANFQARGLADYVDVVQEIGECFSDDASYSASAGYLGGVKKGITRGYGTSQVDEKCQATFQKCKLSVLNKAMEEVVDSFQQDAPGPTPDPDILVIGAQKPERKPDVKKVKKSSLKKSRSARW